MGGSGRPVTPYPVNGYGFMSSFRKTVKLVAALMLATMPLFAYVPDIPSAVSKSLLHVLPVLHGGKTRYTFDNLNRIESAQYPDSTGAGFTYDQNGATTNVSVKYNDNHSSITP